MILALDLGTKCGWATLSGSGEIKSGVVKYSTGDRYREFAAMLERLEPQYQPFKAIYYEKVSRHMGVRAAHVYGGFLGQLEVFSNRSKVPFTGLHVGTIKKHATGKGNANKDQMFVAAREQWPDQNVVDDNQADALWILDLAVNGVGNGN